MAGVGCFNRGCCSGARFWDRQRWQGKLSNAFVVLSNDGMSQTVFSQPCRAADRQPQFSTHQCQWACKSTGAFEALKMEDGGTLE